MADSPMRWVFEIFDKMSGPGKRIADAMRRVERALGGVNTGAKQAAAGVSHMAEMFKGALLARAAERLFDFGKGLIEAGAHNVIHAVEFKENTMLALRTMLGSTAEAEKVFNMAAALANKFGLSTAIMVDSARELLQSGLDVSDAATVLKGAGDIFALEGGGDKGLAKMEQFTQAMKHLAGQEQVSARAIGSLNDIGVDSGRVWAELAKIYGLAGENIKDFKTRFQNSDQFVPSQNLITAALRAVQASTGKPLGSLGVQKGATLEGRVQQFHNLSDQGMMALAGGPGMRALEGVMSNLLKMVRPGSGVWALMKQLIDGPVAQFFQMFSGPEGLARLQEAFGNVLKLVTSTTEALAKLVQLAVGVAAPTKATATIQTGIGDFVDKLFNADPEAGHMAHRRPDGSYYYETPPGSNSTLPKGKTTGMRIDIGGVHVHVQGGSSVDADGLSRRIAQETAAALAAVFDSTAMEAGAA